MVKNIVNGVSGLIHYKGGVAHYTFLMHRISGLGVLVFLSLHILLESTAHYAPHLYDFLNAGLRTPAGLVTEMIMAFLVIFHGVNGFRIAYFDLFHPNLWTPRPALHSVRATWIIAILLWLPAVIIMALHSFHIL